MKISRAQIHDNCGECNQKMQSFLIQVKNKNPQLLDKIAFLEVKVDPARKVEQDDGVNSLFVFSHNNHVYGFFNQAVLQSLAAVQANNFANGIIVLARESLISRAKDKKESDNKTSSVPVSSQTLAKSSSTASPSLTPTNMMVGIAKQNHDLNSKVSPLEKRLINNQVLLMQRQEHLLKTVTQQKRLSKRVLYGIIGAVILIFAGIGVGTWQIINSLHNSGNPPIQWGSGTFDLNDLKHLDSPKEILSPTPNSVSHGTLKFQLKDLVLSTLREWDKGITEQDYVFELYKTSDENSVIDKINLTNSTNIYIRITSAFQSQLLANQTDFIALSLPACKAVGVGDLSTIDTLTFDQDIIVKNINEVTISELYNIYDNYLNDYLNTAFQTTLINKDDYNYEFLLNNSSFTTINLSQAKLVQIEVSAKKDNPILINTTGIIDISLPQAKYNLESFTSLDAIQNLEFVHPDKLTVENLIPYIEKNIISSLENVASPMITTTDDFEYSLYNKDEEQYTEFQLTDPISLEHTIIIYVKVKAAAESMYLANESDYIALSIWQANRIPVKNLQNFSATIQPPLWIPTAGEETTNSELRAQFNSKITDEVQRWAPGSLISADFNYEIYTDSQATNKLTSIDLTQQPTNPGSAVDHAYIVITATENSQHLSEQTKPIMIDLPSSSLGLSLINTIDPPSSWSFQTPTNVPYWVWQPKIVGYFQATVKRLSHINAPPTVSVISAHNQVGDETELVMNPQDFSKPRTIYVKIGPSTATDVTLNCYGETMYLMLPLPAASQA